MRDKGEKDGGHMAVIKKNKKHINIECKLGTVGYSLEKNFKLG